MNASKSTAPLVNKKGQAQTKSTAETKKASKPWAAEDYVSNNTSIEEIK